MVEKPYEWSHGATLEEHSKRKLKILREYFVRYLAVRCQLPQQSRFRLAIVEGFAGGGRYSCGTPGSPLIFIEELCNAAQAFNIKRRAEGMAALDIQCLLILNDADRDAIEALRANVAPLVAAAKDIANRLDLKIEYRNAEFEAVYPEIKALVHQERFRSVIFNLDQCGHTHVSRATLADIMHVQPSAEIFYTFVIEALLAFLQKSNPAHLARQLAHVGLEGHQLFQLQGAMTNKEWLGAAERLVMEAFHTCAPYVSPFSINNPDGWRYWLIHFANSYRARQEYNDILHSNSSEQAHFGRSGLNMLSYDPRYDPGSLYLFDVSGRKAALDQLHNDVPRLISEFGDVIGVGVFYESIYNMTPAHSDDIHAAMLNADDVEVITEAGGERRSTKAIMPQDTLRLKRQRSFFPWFSMSDKKSVEPK